MNSGTFRRSFSVVAACALLHGLNAAPVIFSGADLGAGPSDPRPNSDSAAAAFDLAVAGLGSASLIDFEGVPVGPFSNLAIGQVVINGVDYFGDDQTIMDAPSYPDEPALDGFNTTAGGAKFLEMLAGTTTFSFPNPISAFGAYFTGIQQPVFGLVTLNFDDGSSQVIPLESVEDVDYLGSVQFLGFIDEGASITSITVVSGSEESGDFLGMDDVRFGLLASGASLPDGENHAVPDNGNTAMLALASLVYLAGARRRGR